MPALTAASVAASLREFIAANFLYAREGFALTDDVRLLETGIIDSMGALELVAFLEERFGVTVKDGDISEANLGSIAAIAAYVLRQGNGGAETGDAAA